MFGKSEWFRPKTKGWGLHPIKWQGWLYTLAWMGVIAAPFAALVTRNQAGESLVWLMASLGIFGWDIWSIRRGTQPAQSGHPVLYISEDGTCDQIVTRKV